MDAMIVARRVVFALALLIGTGAAGLSGPVLAAAQEECDPAYPDLCVPPIDEVGDLDCADIGYSNIAVLDPDPHGLDPDLDGVGCESVSAETDSGADADSELAECDPAYPDLCIPTVEEIGDLDCPDIGYSNIAVLDPDPHKLDPDLDGIGCESVKKGSSTTTATTEDVECDPSYPDACLPPAPPDLNCSDIGFAVAVIHDADIGATDPHKLDPDRDGVGCASLGGSSSSSSSSTVGETLECDPSYPDVCLPPPPPDLNCDDIGEPINVIHDEEIDATDPHKLDPDRDGRGCGSYGS